MPKKGITLIGMPGCGKSTLGREIANRLDWEFFDTDHALVLQEGCPLPEILEKKGAAEFMRIEGECILKRSALQDVIVSPGGSIIYHQKAMQKIQKATTVIYLHVPLQELKKRLLNMEDRRGIVGMKYGLEKLYNKRTPRYRKAKDYELPCYNQTPEQTLEDLIALIQRVRVTIDHFFDRLTTPPKRKRRVK